MKNGKVFQKLIKDRRVKKIHFMSEGVANVILADGYYVKDENGHGVHARAVITAKGAQTFIRSAIPMPVAREGYRIVTNLMTGLPVEEAIGTPHGCSVGSESYWCS